MIRKMTAEDSQAVLDVYREGLATGHASFECAVPPWTVWNEKFHPFARYVCEHGGVVVGWGALAPVSPRECYRGVAEVSVYLRTSSQGDGVGSKLLQAVIEDSEHNGMWTLFSSIFPENVATRRLHIRHGFREIGFRERIAKHDGKWRDTLILERRSRVVGV